MYVCVIQGFKNRYITQYVQHRKKLEGTPKGQNTSSWYSCCLELQDQTGRKTGYGYRLQNGAISTHLLYMDDRKLYARSERDTVIWTWEV